MADPPISLPSPSALSTVTNVSKPDSSLLTFGLLILASVAWVVLVVLLLPRLLGRILSFLTNRAARGSFHVSVPLLHIYPLAGRAVAHSACYTVPDGTISVEELVLQVRWWRKTPETQFRELLAVDDAHTLDPVAHAQQLMQREDNANFLKRYYYRFRRWWRRSTFTTDPAAPKEPPPLISLICVGLRARLVNVQANYKHVQHVLNIAKASSRPSANPDAAAFDVPFDGQHSPRPNEYANPQPDAPASSISSSYSSADSVDAKPFGQRLLELVSFRITSGTFYLCDMGQSPLIRLVVNSGKIRYRYGAPACPIDVCRKRFRVRLSGLKLSVADRDTIHRIVNPEGNSACDGDKPETAFQDNTDRMIRRAIDMGYHGLNEPFRASMRNSSKKRPRTSGTFDSETQIPIELRERRQSLRYRSRAEKRAARRKQTLPCADILSSETSVIDYVFDEPGPIAPLQSWRQDAHRAVDDSFEGATEDSGPTPPPVCRVSIVFRGANFSYDVRAVANVERVVERLQPAFYDLMPLAMKAQAGDGKRSATGIQIEVDATPATPALSKSSHGTEAHALLAVPFDPNPITWKTLRMLNIRSWPEQSLNEVTNVESQTTPLPPSSIQIHAKHLSVRSEVPYRIGAQQKTVIVGNDVRSRIEGVVDMPFCDARTLTVVRTMNQPAVWNDLHLSSVEIILKDSEFTYLPDTARVIEDLGTTTAENSKKPSDVRYFVPVKETTKIRAEEAYKVILSCSHDNAWDNILSGQADRYGRMMMSGKNAELVLSPNVSTEYFGNSNVMSWTLSLPEAIGELEIPLSYMPALEQQKGEPLVARRTSDSDRSLYQKGRPPSLAKRVRSQLSTHSQHSNSATVKRQVENMTAKICQIGKVGILSGKVSMNFHHSFLGSKLSVFLDSVNRIDMSFRASSISLDVNPHHVTHFLNMSKNYSSTGNHALSTAERSHLHDKRKSLAQTILNERRYPTPRECVVLGLGAGQILSQNGYHTAMDDLFCMSVQVDSVAFRVHKLPHALCHFSDRSDSVCSALSDGFVGSIRSNRLGSDLKFSPDRKSNRMVLYCEYRTNEDLPDLKATPEAHNLSSPVVLIDRFDVRKRTIASPDWGSYHSALEIRLGEVNGCLMDESVVSLCQIAVATLPDPVYEEQVAVASLLSVDNIDVALGKADLLILSTSTNAYAERSGQRSKLAVLRKDRRKTDSASKSVQQTFLAGVAQLRAPLGVRFCMSNFASDELAARSRLFLPDVTIDVLMSWGGKLTTWVDDATLKAQVAHAILAGRGNSRSSFHDVGLMRRAAEFGESTVEVVIESRPCIWSQAIAHLQKLHVSQESERARGRRPVWCMESAALSEQMARDHSAGEELDLLWWIFLKRSARASIVSKHIDSAKKRHGRLESSSVTISSKSTMLISPECLELANDVIIRCKEKLCVQPPLPHRGENSLGKGSIPEPITEADIITVWDAYEKSLPMWTSPDLAAPSVSLRGLEFKSVRISFLLPILLGEIRRSEELFLPESQGNGVDVSFPLGIHFVEVSKTDVLATKVGEEADEETNVSANAVHVTDLHSSVPSFVISCDGDQICMVSGIILVFRERSSIHRKSAQGPEELGKFVRRDGRTLIGKISSVSIGEKGGSLYLYSCLGRIAAIFVLMSRALALEVSSLLSLRFERINALYEILFQISSDELDRVNSRYVRGFLSQVSKSLREHAESEGRRTLMFSEEMLHFIGDNTTDATHMNLTGRVNRHIMSSIDVALNNISLKVANEDILTADWFVCKGGSTSQAQSSFILDGHVLNASFGTISVSILDDIAANTLKMVSEVASFVRQATFSVRMLRYDGRRDSDHPHALEVLSLDYMNEDFSKARANSLEISRLSQELLPQSARSRGLQARAHAYRPNLRGTRHRRSRLGQFPGHTDSFRTIPTARSLGNPRVLNTWYWKSMQRSLRQTLPSDVSADASCSSRTTHAGSFRDQMQENTFQPRGFVDRRRSRPLPPADSDQRAIQLRERFSLVDAFEENNQLYAYIAIPTAGGAGPPLKRSKTRVRVSPIIPPAFSGCNRGVAADKHGTRGEHRLPSPKRIEDEVDARGPQERTVTFSAVPQAGINKENGTSKSAVVNSNQSSDSRRPMQPKNRAPLTMFVSCHEITARYYRRTLALSYKMPGERMKAELRCSIVEPRLTMMSTPSKGSYSLVATASSSNLSSAKNPSCVLNASVSDIGVTVSVAQGLISSNLPKLIASARISGLKTTLRAKDLRSVLKFREEFKADVKAILSAFFTTKSSISEMARATRLSSSKLSHSGRPIFSTMAFDLLLEESKMSLEGFHPKDGAMSMSYIVDGMFFSVVASEDDNAALTLGVRLYGHRLSIFAPSWPSNEVFHFPSFDARGVQWGETTGLPTLLKVSAEPLVNCTSIQGLRHVLFTIAGLMAFQNTTTADSELNEALLGKSINSTGPESKDIYSEPHSQFNPTGATPFTRSYAAWERTKGIRMDLSIRPMSISLASGQVVALFELGAITGIFEWNKLVVTGVQLHTAVNIPKISLMFIRMPKANFSFSDIRLSEDRASMSVALDSLRVDVLKSQEDLTHTFVFRIEVFAVSGLLRPWRLLIDAAVWADEQEFASDLQSINYTALSSALPRTPRSPRLLEQPNPLEHRIILIGFNIQSFKLSVPLLPSEQYSSSRLALRATELHLLARRRFDSFWTPRRNVLEMKTHFIGVLWENSALLSTHHSRLTLGVERPSIFTDAYFGALKAIMVAGTWRVCPRKDVVMAILDAQNRKDNRSAMGVAKESSGVAPDVSRGCSAVADSISNTTDRRARLLVESLRFKILRTSGFIEGLEGSSYESPARSQRRSLTIARRTETSKMSVPAFSIAVVRDGSHDFDIIDIDFSGREGEFPPRCLEKVANLFSDLFGAVTSDQQTHQMSIDPTRHSRDISRDVSVLIRFGKSLYRAQEVAKTAVESKFCFFAGRTSAILVSLSVKPVLEDLCSHTTVISGISPKLALEITPLIEGANTQSLRLIDARFLYAITPNHPPHTLLHMVKVTALLDTKTLLLTQGRLKTRKKHESSSHGESAVHVLPSNLIAERNVMLVLGRHQKTPIIMTDSDTKEVTTSHIEPDIRLQVKLPLKNESPTNQVDLFVERLHAGFYRARKEPYDGQVPLNIHVALHDVNLRGCWEILSCRLRLRENLFSFSTSNLTSNHGASTTFTNIMNRLHFECMQYGNHTMKLSVDAVAIICSVPKRDILIESTEISSELSHTMIKAIVRLSGQIKKLRSEVSLLMERDLSKGSKRKTLSELYSYDGRSADSLASGQESNVDRDSEVVGESQKQIASVSCEHSELSSSPKTLRRTGKRTKMYIKGDNLRATLRGYQFEETQHSAVIALARYELSYSYDFSSTPQPIHIKRLAIDFANMKIAYNDDERGIHSDLFKLPNPKLKMKVVDTDTELTVELLGDLELKLGHGFYYWQDFKKLSELTIHGIMPTLDPLESVSSAPPDRPEVWDDRIAQVSVRLNPRIDVIGDLTTDMLQFMERRRGRVDIVPKHLHDYVIVPLETLSETVKFAPDCRYALVVQIATLALSRRSNTRKWYSFSYEVEDKRFRIQNY